MLSALNNITRALRDTLITKASGGALTRLSAFYGLQRPTAIPEEDWRQALRAVVWGARGTLGCTHGFLEGVYASAVRQYQINIDNASPHLVSFVSGPAGESDFRCDHVNRLVKIRFLPKSAYPLDPVLLLSDPLQQLPWRTRLFFVVGPTFIGGGGSATLELAPYDSGYWDGCNWAGGANAVDLAAEPAAGLAYMDVLPFFYTEPTPGPVAPASAGEPCIFKLYAEESVLTTAPPTYLLEYQGLGVDVDRDAVDVNMPDQGHMMDELNITGAVPEPPDQGDQTLGPKPLYLAGGETTSFAELLDLLLVAGVHVREIKHTFC